MNDVEGTLEVRSDKPLVVAALLGLALGIGVTLWLGFASLRGDIADIDRGEIRCVATTMQHRDGLACGWEEP